MAVCSRCTTERPIRAKGLCAACYERGRRERHPEMAAEIQRGYRARHPDRSAESVKRYQEAHREWKARYQRLYADEHRDALRRYISQYRVANAARISVYRHNRRALEKALPATLTVAEWQAILAAHQHRCAYCGTDALPLTQDHVVPVSRGGGTTADNIVPACQPCNSGKGARRGWVPRIPEAVPA